MTIRTGLLLTALIALASAAFAAPVAGAEEAAPAVAFHVAEQAATPPASSEAQPPEAPSGWAAFLWWLLVPIGLLLMLAAALSTAKVHPDFIGTFGPWWAVLIKRGAERHRRRDGR